MDKKRNRIGILGGMGPQAGFDLAGKITAATPVTADQDHHSLIVFSLPADVPDRTAFLLGENVENPAESLIEQLEMMERLDIGVVAIACNTAHAPPIFDQLTEAIHERGMHLQLLNLIEETVAHIRRSHPGVRRVGVLGTPATFRFQLYDQALAGAGLDVVLPNKAIRTDSVFPAIFDARFGIKVKASPVSDLAREHVSKAIVHLKESGAEAVILGCTELPLAVAASESGRFHGSNQPRPGTDDVESGTNVLIIDPAVAMANALISFIENT